MKSWACSQRATELGEAFRTQLAPLVEELPFVVELRVCGLMIGLELSVPGAPIVQHCLDHGLLINCTQGNVIRLLPAMTLTDEELESRLRHAHHGTPRTYALEINITSY